MLQEWISFVIPIHLKEKKAQISSIVNDHSVTVIP